MEWTCQLIDLTGSDLATTWQDQLAGQDMAMPVACTTDVAAAVGEIGSGKVLVMVIWARDYNEEIQSLLRAYQASIGCLADFQAIVCGEPTPAFMAGVFEFGIEQFVALDTWPGEVAAICRRAMEAVANPESAEAKTLDLARSIRSADQAAIQKAATAIGDLAEYDFRVAFAKGKAAEATGDYAQAVDIFKNARGMNKMFRPSIASLGETLLITGRIDEALDVFKSLEKTNPYDVERKANIAAAYVEKGDFESANRYVEAAAKLAPNNSKVLEARAQVLLCQGKVGEAIKLMDSMSEVGPFFAAKLNELGIKMSQAGKGKQALALYQKAHKIVRANLKYKISLNAALACRRLKAYDMALKYAARCQKEYGSPFPKLDKIRQAIAAEASQAQAAGDLAPGDPGASDKAG